MKINILIGNIINTEVQRRRASSCGRVLERKLDKYEEMEERIQEQRDKVKFKR